jgi:UDP-N-acetyl-D-glucosamine/UDP-N-acetyl-D-galactosamine dehydrogenase
MVPESALKRTVCVVGLGVVGYPLARAFSTKIPTIGFDIDAGKIHSINSHADNKILATTNAEMIKNADIIIIAVPTPITKAKDPDLCFIRSAAKIVGKNMKTGAIVVLESSVYPGVTEEIMAPILEQQSGLVCGRDFRVGYSPERINPADDEHTLEKITKIVAGMDPETTGILAETYSLVTAVYRARDIKTAEAAKIIENIQRDLNIALVNELSLIFSRMGIDTKAVLDAAATKWNFIKFTPGLVGGHCIPVDPYYLVYKAEETGYHPQVILAGRMINDYMPKHVAHLAIIGMNSAGNVIRHAKVLIMGLSYKENVPDVRESPVHEIVNELNQYSVDIYGYDPLLSAEEIAKFGIKPLSALNAFTADCVIITVAHDQFRKLSLSDIEGLFGKGGPVIIDVKGMLPGIPKKGFYRKL